MPARAPRARIAQPRGYFDQEHLISDFKALAGITPTEYEATRSSVGRGCARHLLATARTPRQGREVRALVTMGAIGPSFQGRSTRRERQPR